LAERVRRVGRVEVAVRPRVGTFRGEERVDLHVADVRPAAAQRAAWLAAEVERRRRWTAEPYPDRGRVTRGDAALERGAAAGGGGPWEGAGGRARGPRRPGGRGGCPGPPPAGVAPAYGARGGGDPARGGRAGARGRQRAGLGAGPAGPARLRPQPQPALPHRDG